MSVFNRSGSLARPFKPKWIVVLLALVASAAAFSGCGGSAFTSNDSGAGASSASGGSSSGASTSGGTSNGGMSGSVGTGAGTGKSCSGPEECDDHDPCTTDSCNGDGTCGTQQKCGTLKCCKGGDCAECCANSDCDDGKDCTTNTCFMGQCMFVPDDAKCDATQYCSAKDGCRAKQACGLSPDEPATICDDGSGCTVDSCGANNLCEHAYCPDQTAKLCCGGNNCAACCNDQQCDTDSDPCMVGSCQNGQCSVTRLCGDGEQCCPSSDRKTATCGSCCTATDCDDKIGCTLDLCGGGQCSHTPSNDRCDAGYVCDPNGPTPGCTKAPDCKSNDDCHPTGCQTNATCSNGTCHFDDCAVGTKCCTDHCATCCSDQECGDNVDCTTDACTANGCTHTPDPTQCGGLTCDPALGCVECLTEKECADDLPCTKDTCENHKCVHTAGCDAAMPYCTTGGCVQCISDGDCQGGGGPQPAIAAGCSKTTCQTGTCKTANQLCLIGQVCCAPYGCLKACPVNLQ